MAIGPCCYWSPPSGHPCVNMIGAFLLAQPNQPNSGRTWRAQTKVTPFNYLRTVPIDLRIGFFLSNIHIQPRRLDRENDRIYPEMKSLDWQIY